MKSALELGRNIAAGKIDPVELAEETLEKIDAHPHRDNIFSDVTRDRALSEAEASRKRQQFSALLSPLDGVPISWKDLFDTARSSTEAGSLLLAGRVPEKDCTALENASQAGLVCIGKTHLSELAFSGLGINPKTATSPNRQGTHLAPGGSSSGAAASVAYDLVPIGIGSDTGGSVRIPSAWNDLVGFKTTHGLISNQGVVPLCSGFDTVGPLCNNMEDAWTMTAIMAGLSPELPEAKPIEQCKFLINEPLLLDDLDNDQREGFELAVEVLQSAGAHVERTSFPEFDQILSLGPILFPYEAWKQWGDVISANPGIMFEPIENRFRSGEAVSQEQYTQAWQTMMELREDLNQKTGYFDGFLAPTVAIGPPEIEPLLNDAELFGATNMMALRNTRFFNMFGSCALALPTTKPASSLMLVVEGGNDSALASLGLTVEKIIR